MVSFALRISRVLCVAWYLFALHVDPSLVARCRGTRCLLRGRARAEDGPIDCVGSSLPPSRRSTSGQSPRSSMGKMEGLGPGLPWWSVMNSQSWANSSLIGPSAPPRLPVATNRLASTWLQPLIPIG